MINFKQNIIQSPYIKAAINWSNAQGDLNLIKEILKAEPGKEVRIEILNTEDSDEIS